MLCKTPNLVIVVFSVITVGCVVQSGLPPGVNAESVRTLSLGMPRSEIERLLGPPLAVESEVGCESASLRRVTQLKYFRAPVLKQIVRYPMLWVYLCDGLVHSVEAREGDPVDSEDVFILREDLAWESPEFRKPFPSASLTK